MDKMKNEIETLIRGLVENGKGNVISPEWAVSEQDIGQKMYERPLVKAASAEDPLWEEFRKPEARLPILKLPREWLPDAKTVIVYFAPYSDYVTESNKKDPRYPGSGWMNAYYHGAKFLSGVTHSVIEYLKSKGYEAFDPYTSDRFVSVTDPAPGSDISFTSNWSVRHAAFVSGMGTFGLSRGLITERGVAGRFGTIITSLEIAADKRPYSGLYDYCSMCGKCSINCPSGAISLETGKDHHICQEWLASFEAEHPGMDCCGKCQVNVPCERRIPVAKYGKIVENI